MADLPAGYLTVVEMVYHQLTAGQPVVAESRFGRPLKTDEQPYRRTFRLGEQWVSVETGWVDQPAMLMISNETGKGLTANPTQEMRDELSRKVIEMGVSVCSVIEDTVVPVLKILPGESFRGQPSEIGSLRVRCAHGETKCTVTAIPE
jgi:hypothetical protein